MRVSVVIPAYNESRVIGDVVGAVRSRVDEVIVVDDGSSDQTWAVARKAGARAVRHPVNRGQGAALQTGLTLALARGADIIVTFDADGQHRVEDIDLLIRPIMERKCAVVLGSRFLQSQSIPWLRKLVLRTAVRATRFYTGLNVTDVHNGLRAFSREAALMITITQDRMAHASEILEQIKKHQLQYTEVPVSIMYTEYARRKGQRTRAAGKIFFDLFIGRLLK